MLVGNKCDDKDNIKISKAEADKFCKKHDCLAYFEVSAKENINIDEVFFTVATAAFHVDAA